MPQSKRGERLDVESSRIHDKMEKAYDMLDDAISELLSLEDDYDLAEHSIERVDSWVESIRWELGPVGNLLKDLEAWGFDGDSLVEIIEDE